MQPSEILRCPLCERSGESRFSKHHIIPRSRGGTEVVMICCDCHRQIHIFFDNKELEKEYCTIDDLQTNEKFHKYLEWVKNKPIGVLKKTPKKFIARCKKAKFY